MPSMVLGVGVTNTYSGSDSIKIQLKEESFGLLFDTNFIP